MKKSIMILSFMLACVMMCCLFTTKGSNKFVRASSRTINNNQTIIVVGKGEIDVEPDIVQINFGLKTRADSLKEGQTKIKESFDNVVSKLKQLDDKSSVSVCYSSSYPVSEGGLLAYEFDCCLTAKSSKVDKANDIVNTIISAGATSVHNTSYTLLDREDAYVKALVKAKDNADQKVRAMYNDAKLVGLREEACYSCCESSKGENIKVCARVKAFYEVGSLNENISTTNTATQTSNTKNFVNNTEKNLTNNEEKTNKNLEKNNEEKQEGLTTQNQKENINNNSITQTTNSQSNLENKQSIETTNEQNLNKKEETKEDKQIKNSSINETENNNKNLQENESVEKDLNNKNDTSANTFGQEKNDAVNVLNDSKTTQNQNKKSSKINANNLIVKADKTLARNDDFSLNEEYKEIA